MIHSSAATLGPLPGPKHTRFRALTLALAPRSLPCLLPHIHTAHVPLRRTLLAFPLLNAAYPAIHPFLCSHVPNSPILLYLFLSYQLTYEILYNVLTY